MKDLLKSIGLLQEFTVQLDCPKSYFIQTLGKHVDDSGFDLLELFTSGRPFKGKITGDAFSIRKRKRLFNTNVNIVKLNGIVQQKDEKSIVSVQTNINSRLWYASIPLLALIVFQLITPAFDNSTTENFILVFALQMSVLLAILYISLRGAVNHARNETEKEFVWIVKNYRGR